MKRCLNCDIEVGGNLEVCPLCQHGLTGEATESNWPYLIRLKTKAFLYKLQLFLVLAVVVVGLGLDFLVGLNDGRHWSLLGTLTLVIIEVTLKSFLKKKSVASKYVSVGGFWLAVILFLTAQCYGFLPPVINLVFPIALSAIIVADFVLTLADKTGNALVYLLVNILFALVIYGVLFFKKYAISLSWNICLMIGVVTLIGMFVFLGRKVTSEFERRMNI